MGAIRVCLHLLKCVYILFFAQARQDDPNATERRGMEGNRSDPAGQRRRAWSNGYGQSLVSRSCTVDRTHGQSVARSASAVWSMAHGVHTFLALATQRRLATGRACARRRNGNRAHPHRCDHCESAPAFGRGIKKGGPQALGRSRGGLSTKLHVAVDATGRPLRLIITEGQVADISCANELMEHLRAKAVIADKGYDADAFVQTIGATGAKLVIPPRSNRRTKRRYSRTL